MDERGVMGPQLGIGEDFGARLAPLAELLGELLVAPQVRLTHGGPRALDHVVEVADGHGARAHLPNGDEPQICSAGSRHYRRCSTMCIARGRSWLCGTRRLAVLSRTR